MTDIETLAVYLKESHKPSIREVMLGDFRVVESIEVPPGKIDVWDHTGIIARFTFKGDEEGNS